MSGIKNILIRTAGSFAMFPEAIDDTFHEIPEGEKEIKALILDMLGTASDNYTKYIDPNELKKMVNEL